MKSFFPCLAFVVICQSSAINICSAQSDKTPATLQAPPPKIAVDGDIKEWGDSLRYYNSEKKINYSIANTKDTLYMAIRINDRSEQTRILKAGLTFTIDPKGKKKEAYSITFPVNTSGKVSLTDLQSKDEAPGEVTQQERDELMRERITTLRGIKVVGFKDIEDDMITTSNTYGFQTAVNYDENGYLVCEAAIPMSFFHVDDPAKNEWSFNFRINGLQHKAPGESDDQDGSGGHSGRGGGGGGGMGGGGGHHGSKGGSHASTTGDEGHDALFKSEDFWEKFYLAK
jgi:YD repeat-containing protein